MSQFVKVPVITPAAWVRGQRLLTAVATAALLASCGGGKTVDATAQAVDGIKTAQGVVPSTAVPADANTKGMWGPVYNWPIIPIHAVLMPDGRLMTFGSTANGASTGFFSIDVWDGVGAPDVGHANYSNSTGTDIFCASQLLLPPASATSVPNVFVAGGDVYNGVTNTFVGNNRSTVFNTGTNEIIRGADMGLPRWYSSSTTLVNGETYIQGGSGGAARPEVRQLDGSFRQLTGIDTNFLAWSYPRNFVLPDSSLFGYDFEGRMYFVNTAGTGSMAVKNILPLQYFGAGTAAMFRPGRILQVGGNSNASAIIDVTSGAPVFTPTQSTNSVRKLANATILADGQVLLTGGSPVWNELQDAAKAAEIWNPTTGQWTLGAEGARPRLYHSSALLLPDATVITGGGGAPAPVGADGQGERNVEIYYPPYLFTANGTRAVRPVISQAPDWLEIGKTVNLQITGSNGVSRVTLVKTGSVTHGYNLDQRFVELSFTASATATGSSLAVNTPALAGEVTPGYYMLFVFDGAGVPSEARMLRMGVAGAINTQLSPRIVNPGAITGTAGTAQSLQLSATDPNGDVLTYSAASLPPGMSLNPATGAITGTPSDGGAYNVVVSASDGVYSHTARFVWTVITPTPLTLTLSPTPSASLSGGSAAFAAGATGVGVEYAWNFGDGSATTAWSSQSTINKVFAKPGTYTVTLTIRDATGATITRSFLQTVYLGNPDKPSRASSSLLIEAPLLGSDRLWVVNQDNDTISGFDTVSKAKLGEVAVGASPRSIAVDAKGLLWVTNKADATISIVDPATRKLVNTLALPRASQPHGVVISPVADLAYVVLEATGQLLRFDTATFTQTGQVSVGANPRHVSVLGNGKQVYVTRFITPPMPGEATLAVDVGTGLGGEVVEVDAATLVASRTIVLAPSTRADAENQGRGVPNYLGPFSISPDASQAYVPSKQDNIQRGTLRDGNALNFQNTVRAISSRVLLKSGSAPAESLAGRVDHDNASLATAVAYERRGVYMFVALETSREVAVIDAHSGAQVMRFDVGRAPQGLVLSSDSYTLYVNNFMDRTVSVHDLRPLLNDGVANVPTLSTWQAVASERLAANVLAGKQLFYDARDTRLARDRYMSCASCHNDGGHDGRVWDLGHAGEGLRNTISLRGRAGEQGRLHWSGNFDEVQDFEGQIRTLSGGTGLMPDADFSTGTRSQPLGDKKAGVSVDLDALAAYVSSLNSFAPSPARQANGTMTVEAVAGKTVFGAKCASCHSGASFTDSAKLVLHNVGTQKPASGQRLGKLLSGLDVPTLRDVWATAPYLHDGSAATLEAAVQAHGGITLTSAELANVVAYTQQVGGEESAAPASEANLVVRMLATLMDQVGALFEVRVNNTVVASGQLDSRSYVDILIDTAKLVKDAIVEVVFKNDANSATEDRNLAVQSITLNGVVSLAATAPGVVIDKGVGALAFDNLNTVAAAASGGWMPWDSAMRFTVPTLGGSDTVVVRAGASLAGGVGAQMELRINGVQVATQLVSNNVAPQDYSFTTPTVAAGDRIDIVFTNDAQVGTEDRNLYVQSITAHGVTLLSTAAGVTLDQGAGAQAFDGVGVVPASTFSGWLPWNGAMRFVAQ